MSKQVCKKCEKSFDPRSSVLPPIPGSTGVECPYCGSWEKLPDADALEAEGITDYCGQVCGGGECGSGKVCLYGIDPTTHMPPQ